MDGHHLTQNEIVHRHPQYLGCLLVRHHQGREFVAEEIGIQDHHLRYTGEFDRVPDGKPSRDAALAIHEG
jgi:predicted transcriptional regulator